MPMKLIKENEKGKTYQTEKCKILYRNKGSISGDNTENPKELIYLVSGSASVTLGDETWDVRAPGTIEFPKRTYHKIEALTDIIFILFEK